jgi:hypothetical protein
VKVIFSGTNLGNHVLSGTTNTVLTTGIDIAADTLDRNVAWEHVCVLLVMGRETKHDTDAFVLAHICTIFQHYS